MSIAEFVYTVNVGALMLPPTIYAPTGVNLTIYHRNICVARDPSVFTWSYVFVPTADPSSIVTGTVTDTTCVIQFSGDGTLTVTCTDAAGGVITKNCAVKTYNPATPVTAKKVLFVGDSLTAAAEYPAQVKTAVPTLTLIGTQGTSTKHEGHSGFSFQKFCTDATSPFVFSSVLNIPSYLAVLADTPDIVVFELGINDLINYTMSNYTAGLTLWKQYADTLIAAFAAALPSAKLYMTTTTRCNALPYGCWWSYGRVGSTINDWTWGQVRRQLLAAQVTNYSARLIPAHLLLDTRGGMDFTNGVHPNSAGYVQMGNEIAYGLSWLILN